MAGSSFDPIPRQQIDASSLTTSYQVFEINGLGDEAQIFKMLNNSNVDVDISYDGVVDHDIIPAGGAFILDFTANKERTYGSLRNRQLVYIKVTDDDSAISPKTKKIYICGYTQRKS